MSHEIPENPAFAFWGKLPRRSGGAEGRENQSGRRLFHECRRSPPGSEPLKEAFRRPVVKDENVPERPSLEGWGTVPEEEADESSHRPFQKLNRFLSL